MAVKGLKKSTHVNSPIAHSINIVHLVALFAPAPGQKIQVGIIDWEVRVVVLQDLGGGALDGELAQGVTPGLAVRGAHNFDIEGGGGVAKLQQDDGQVVNKEQGVNQ